MQGRLTCALWAADVVQGAAACIVQGAGREMMQAEEADGVSATSCETMAKADEMRVLWYERTREASAQTVDPQGG